MIKYKDENTFEGVGIKDLIGQKYSNNKSVLLS